MNPVGPISSERQREAGYTLVESLVAMALVVSVLIPLGVTLGTFSFDQQGSRITHALRLAQNELNTAILDGDFSAEQITPVQQFLIHRTTDRTGVLITIRVSVALEKKASQPLVTLHKSVLVYP